MKVFFDSSIKQNRLIRYKLYHIPFWFVYNYLWWVATIGDPVKAAVAIFYSPFSVKFSFYVIFHALAACFNLYFLIPKYLEKDRYTEYITYLFFTILFAAALIVPGYYLGAAIAGKTLPEMYGPGSYSYYRLFIGSPLSSTTASVTLAMSIKLAKNWLQTRRREQMLEKEKLETELKFLKNQFNPHFLFNTINSIFFLIHKNPHMASAALAKFSELLRYQLYECNDKQIQLSKEIAYIENSIELEKLRLNDNVKVICKLNQQPMDHLGIAPFILMTFIENAFKHVSKHTDQPNWIKIDLTIEGQQLDFSVSNSTSQNTFNEVISYSGIGLKNVQRRLDLIYPGKYNLNIQSIATSYSVRLQLLLSELATPQLMQKTA